MLLIRMPVTTFDIPEDLLSFIDSLVRSGKVRSRREIVVRALEIFVRLQAHEWDGPLISIYGIRKGLISKGSIGELVAGMSNADLYNAGKRMGKTLKDLAMNLRLDISRPENHMAALQMLEDFGWARFAMDHERITITGAFLPAPVIHGYLESALSVALSRVETTEEIVAFEISAVHAVKTR